MDSELQEQILDYLGEGKSATDVVKILKEKGTTISKATVNRYRKFLSAIGDTRPLNDRERSIYMDYMERKNHEKQSKKQSILRFFAPVFRTAADGPMDMNMPEFSMNGHQNFLDKYIPQNTIEAIHVDVGNDGKINSKPMSFTAAIASIKNSIPKYPKYFWNPYTALDLIVFQDVYTHTICGTIIDILVNFTIGLGVKPVLKLIDEDDIEIKTKKEKSKNSETGKDEEKDRQETKQEAIERILKENENLLDPIIAIDEYMGDLPDCPGVQESWNDKVEALIRNHWIFGRDIITMEINSDYIFEYKGEKYPKIRTISKVQHPRDLNFVEIDQVTETVTAVSLMFTAEMVTKDEMIYLAHMTNSPIYNGKKYGYSKMQRMLGDGRSLRKLKDRDFPNIASIGYAPFTIVAMKKDEKGTTNENTQNQAFANTMVAGQPNFTTLKDPKEYLVVHHIDTDPKISEMIEMAHYHAEAAAKTCQVPTSLVAKEKDPNRDTMLGILRVFAEGQIPRIRPPIVRALTQQHYMVNWKEIYKGKSEITNKFRVEAQFTDIKIDSWADIINGFLELNKLFRFTPEAAGEILGIENLENKIDPEKEPLGESSKFEGADGSTLEISKPSKPSKPAKST